MALAPGSTGLLAVASNAVADVAQWVQGFFTPEDYSPEATLEQMPFLDPRFKPRAPMSADNIDVHTLNELGKRGLKRGKLITAQTHPEFYRAWAANCARAGLAHPPQLILAESNIANALTLSPEEVVITTGLLKFLDLREVSAILGHELGHETSNHKLPRVLATSVFGGMGLWAGNDFGHWGGIGKLIDHTKPNPGLIRRMMTRWFDTGEKSASLMATGIYMAAGASVGSVIANQLTVRPTELDADRKGAMISGDPEALISALTKLSQAEQKHPLRTALGYLTSGYPSMSTRIARLQNIAREMHAQPMPTLPQVPEQAPAAPVVTAQPNAQPGHRVVAVMPVEARLGTPVVAQHSA